jgi:hypothetical protein
MYVCGQPNILNRIWSKKAKSLMMPLPLTASRHIFVHVEKRAERFSQAIGAPQKRGHVSCSHR